jgi:hypothetical protein
MTRKFAEDTIVPVAKSRSEIEALVTKHGATKFMSFFEEGRAVIAFGMKDRLVRFTITLPDRKDRKFTHTAHKDTWNQYLRNADQQEKAYQAELRRIWRALLLVIKAKLEAVHSEITTFEQEFLPFIVLADGQTVGETIIPRLNGQAGSLDITRMLPMPTGGDE